MVWNHIQNSGLTTVYFGNYILIRINRSPETTRKAVEKEVAAREVQHKETGTGGNVKLFQNVVNDSNKKKSLRLPVMYVEVCHIKR